MTFLILMFLTRECLGVSNISDPEGRIVKGWKVHMHQYPYSVYLRFEKSSPACCGSSLITDQAVLTAAECLDELEHHNGKITAYLGAVIPKQSITKRSIIVYTIHPRYNPDKGKFNLGIGYFDKPVVFSDQLQKIPIISKFPQVDEIVYTVGWGKQYYQKYHQTDYSSARNMKISKQKIMSIKDCAKTTTYKKTPALWCTQSINGYHYHGDCGNGLVSKEKTLVGVVSFMVDEMTVYSDVVREQRWAAESIIKLLRMFCKIQRDRKKRIHKIV